MENPRVIVHVHPLDGDEEHHFPRSTRSHHFAHQVQVFCPGISIKPSPELACPAFTVATIRPVAVLNEEFVRDYIRRGSLYVMSTGSAVDRHNTLCIAVGILHLTVDAETYRRLGLVGTPSAVHPSGQFFHVQVDLRGEGFRTGDSNYDRTHWCLERMQPVRVLASHIIDGVASSAVHFARELQTENKQARCRESSHALPSDARIPTPQSLSTLGETPDTAELAADEMTDLVEWLGFAHGNLRGCISSGAPVDDFATILLSPQVLACLPGTGHVRQLRGFLSPPAVNEVLSSTIQQVRSGHLPWASLVVWGFEDAPLSWGNSAHSFAAGSMSVYLSLFLSLSLSLSLAVYVLCKMFHLHVLLHLHVFLHVCPGVVLLF